MVKKKKDITAERTFYRPFEYEWAYEAWLRSEQAHWLHTEVRMHEDIHDWKTKLGEDDKALLTNLFRFFTQGDIDVAGGYVNNYLPLFKKPELRMMLLSFAAREGVHIAAYSNLIETLGMPDTIYSEFLQYKEMKAKHDFAAQYADGNPEQIAEQIAVFSAFTEGLQLFSTFVMLLNYPRHGEMKGMGEIVTWSIVDETEHVDGLTKAFRAYIEENRHLWTDELKQKLYAIAEKMVEMEFDFIDLCYGVNASMRNLDKEDLKQYIRYIANRRLIGLGLKGIFKGPDGKLVKKNNLPWVDEMINAPIHGNFFEVTVTDYSKGAMTGDWSDVWGSIKDATPPPKDPSRVVVYTAWKSELTFWDKLLDSYYAVKQAFNR